MSEKSINTVLSEALEFYMGTQWNYTTLGAAAKLAPNTIKNYCKPEERDQGASGKEPSAKLTELAQIAKVLQVEVADLVTDATNHERQMSQRRRAADYYAKHGRLPSWAPTEDTEVESWKRPATGT